MALTLHIQWNKSDDMQTDWTVSPWKAKTVSCVTSHSPHDLTQYSILDASVRQAPRNIHYTQKNVSGCTLPFSTNANI